MKPPDPEVQITEEDREKAHDWMVFENACDPRIVFSSLTQNRLARFSAERRADARKQALDEVNRLNSHFGAGPHCTCSQAEREALR